MMIVIALVVIAVVAWAEYEMMKGDDDG